MRSLLILLPVMLLGSISLRAQKHEPVIDMHLHAIAHWSDDDTAWFPEQFKRPVNDILIMVETVRAMDKYNVVLAVASGSQRYVQKWKKAYPGRFLGGYEPSYPTPPRDSVVLREKVRSEDIQVFAEISTQYGGVNPSDTSMERMFKLAEELDVPVGIHMGLGPPGIARYLDYRSRLSSPLLMEEALLRHPKVRFYIMHAGWPMLDDMVAMLYAFPNLYVDIAVINWYIPKAEFYFYLKRLVDAGYGKRIMYGSDQMQWPQAIGASIKTIEEAPFLTQEQKRDILYNNAARFLRLRGAK